MLTSITLAYDSAIASPSVAENGHFTLALGLRKKGHVRFTKKVAVSHSAPGTAPNLVIITLAKPVKGPIQVTALPGVRGVNGALSSSSYMTIVN
jgi:hypothetical protein